MRLTAAELAERLGVRRTAIDAWERGDEPIDDPTLLERLTSLEGNPSANEGGAREGRQASAPRPPSSSHPDPSEA